MSPPRKVRKVRLQQLLKPQRRTIASREEREVQVSLFCPPRKRRAARHTAAVAVIATESDVGKFVESFGSKWKVSTSWQWNGDKENALQQAALSNSLPIGTLLPTLKLLLLDRAKRLAALHTQTVSVGEE